MSKKEAVANSKDVLASKKTDARRRRAEVEFKPSLRRQKMKSRDYNVDQVNENRRQTMKPRSSGGFATKQEARYLGTIVLSLNLSRFRDRYEGTDALCPFGLERPERAVGQR
jgi:hypothetical protein